MVLTLFKFRELISEIFSSEFSDPDRSESSSLALLDDEESPAFALPLKLKQITTDTFWL